MNGKRIFLLGGKDLEMQAIKKMLSAHEELVVDRSLTWDTAKTSAYKDVFRDNSDKTFVLVELFIDCDIPADALVVDHHNENSHRPSSLEQIAEMLDVSLNRDQQLIAANDRGYISAMREVGANDEEINDIRRRDRLCQGVTEEEELVAATDVAKANIENGVTVVHTSLTKFSPIVDRLIDAKRIIVMSNDELTYYGTDAILLSQAFSEDISKGNAYYGGGRNGYFGFKKGVLSSEQLVNRKKQITATL